MAKKQKNKRMARLIFILIFLLGASAIAFPIVSQYLYFQAARVEVVQFEQGVQNLQSDEIKARLKLADAYNTALKEGAVANFKDPYSEDEKEEGVAEYARMLEVHEQIGYVEIPKINEKLPIYAGTAETVLQKGVGHLEASSLPIGGESTHSILTAHRGLPTARLFTSLDKLEEGDIFFVNNIGGTLAYQVDQIKVIEPHQIEELAIVEGEDYTTLLTCTPYMVNSHRLLVRGHRIPYTPEVREEVKQAQGLNVIVYYMLALLALVVLIGLSYVRKRLKQRQKRRKSK